MISLVVSGLHRSRAGEAMNFGKVVLEVKNENGCVLIYRPLPDVVVTVSEGFITHNLWAPQVPFYDALHQQVPKLHVFPRRVERALRRARLCERLAGLREGEQGRSTPRFCSCSAPAVIALAINPASLVSRAPISACGKEAWEKRLEAALHHRQAA